MVSSRGSLLRLRLHGDSTSEGVCLPTRSNKDGGSNTSGQGHTDSQKCMFRIIPHLDVKKDGLEKHCRKQLWL